MSAPAPPMSRTTAVALASTLTLAGVAGYSATVWNAGAHVATMIVLVVVGVLLAALVYADRRSGDTTRSDWHDKAVAIGALGSLVLLGGIGLTDPLVVTWDPAEAVLKVAGEPMEPNDGRLEARVWPEDAEIPLVLEPLSPECREHRTFRRVQDVVQAADHHWAAEVDCPTSK